jgi:ATP-dependent helicase HrpA
VLVIAAALSVQDPRERPAEQRPQADQQHARFRDPASDFLTLLNLWRYLRRRQRELSSSAFRRMCRAEFLNYLRVREWQDLEAQLRQVAKQLDLKVGKPADEPDADGIHQALLSGLLSHIGVKEPERDDRPAGRSAPKRQGSRRGDYLGARNTRFAIFPGSGLFRKQPAMVMAAELVETSRLWARTNAAIRPEWAERAGAHLVRRTYSEPHWSKKRAAVMAYEKVTLYGVPLVADRLVSYGSVDPALARELFIRHALVYGEWETRHDFFTRNRALLDEVEELEHRARRRDILVDEHTLFDFYDARVGEEVVSGAHFDSWWRTVSRRRPDLLTFDPQMLVNPAVQDVEEHDYPDRWREGELEFDLHYQFEPGSAADGVTVELPVDTLNQVDPSWFGWQVPGLRQDLVVALIRSLPKQLRVNFVPAPDHARAFLATASPGEESLVEALGRHLRATTGVVVPDDAWDWGKVPEHLRPTYRVVDERGRALAEGKDLAALREELRPHAAAAVADAGAGSGLHATGETTWTFGAIPRTFTQARAGHEIRGHPALVEETDRPGTPTVGLRVLGSEAEQEASMRRGLRRLVMHALRSPVPEVTHGLSNAQKLALAGSPYPSTADLLEDCFAAAVDTVVAERGPVWDEAGFDRLVDLAAGSVTERTRAVVQDVERVLSAWRETDRLLSGSVEMPMLPALSDMKAQVGRLVHAGFVSQVGASQLRELPRYLAAVRHRRERLPDSVGRDRLLMDQVTAVQEAYLHRLAALPPGRPPGTALTRVRWMIEELRVSLWAQHLGTAHPVSETRVRKALQAA